MDGVARSVFELFGHPDNTIEMILAGFPELKGSGPEIWRQLQRDARYAPYLARQEQDVARLRRDAGVRLPADTVYAGISGLSGELRQKLDLVRPETLAHAARIEGMTPVALTRILLSLRRKQASPAAS